MGIVIVKELVIIIGIGQLKWHGLQEHVDLIDSQDTMV